MRYGPIWLAVVSIFVSTIAGAQQAPPPGYPPPPPYYAPPPAGYPYPPPQSYKPPEVLPYKEGQPIPVGYHLEERPRTGLITTGWILTAIPYGIALIAAVSADFKNASGFLAVPFAGPWLTLGRRDYGCDATNDEKNREGLECVGDVFVVMGLIMDGMMQAAGGTLLLIGYMSPKTQLIRDDAKLRIRPMRVGSGHGLGVGGTF